MASIILRDDFTGSGTLEGHAANVNTLGAGGVWSSTGNAELSGGYLQCPAAGYAVGSMFEGAPAEVGLPMRYTFRWKPAGDQSAYGTGGAVYPIGLNFGAGTVWLTNGPSGCEMLFRASGVLWPEATAAVTFSDGVWYDGEITVADGVQTLNFLGQTLTLGDEMLPEHLVCSLYVNMSTLPDGTSGMLDFVQAETIEVQKFWTRHVNTKEVSS